MIMKMIANPSNRWNGCLKIILVIQVIKISSIKISMVIRNAISILCFLVIAAMKYVRIIRAAMTIIKMSNIFMTSPRLYQVLVFITDTYVYM